MINNSSTKIVATIGPSTDSPVSIKKLILAGVSVFRFNLKHNTQKWHSVRIGMIRGACKELNRPVAILLDLQGPEIRIGTFTNGELEVERGEKVFFVLETKDAKRKEVILNNLTLMEKLDRGQEFSIDDGKFKFKVVGKKEGEIITVVLEGGIIKSKKGLNIPELELDLPTLVEKDIEDISLAAREDVDFIALSFVRRGEDIKTLREELKRQGVGAKIVAKIETALALKNFEEILAETDGVMVARGDLGIEMPIEQVPYYQKLIIRRCLEVGKPVITATQMLESMIVNPSPTRAEVSDVANAIYDFTDAIMLSAETAAGLYPEKAVEMMQRIAKFTESKRPGVGNISYEVKSRGAAITMSAARLMESEIVMGGDVKAFVVLTESGFSAEMLSRLRPSFPIIALTRSQKVRDQMMLLYGVVPLLFQYDDNIIGKQEMERVKEIIKVVTNAGFVKTGDKIIMVYGEEWGVTGKTSVVRIQEIG